MKFIKPPELCWRCSTALQRTASNKRPWLNPLRRLSRAPTVTTVCIQPFTSRISKKSIKRNQTGEHSTRLNSKPTERQIEASVRAAKQEYGDNLPEGLLSIDERNVYNRLYGPPIIFSEHDQVSHKLNQAGLDADTSDKLFRQGNDGALEEVEVFYEDRTASIEFDQDASADLWLGQYAHDQGNEASNMEEIEDEVSVVRSHPFTIASRSGSSTSTIELPKQSFVDPITKLLADISNKHIDEASNRSLGGPGLPYGTGTPVTSRTLPQKPIPLSSSHARMSDIEADVFLATVMPGTYAAISSILKELRKRMGSDWLEALLKKESGPNILDLGSGGAGVIAWRECLTAEWHRVHSTDPLDSKNPMQPEFGKATVVTGSPALRQRSATLLENTTFLPRLPDYIHTHFKSLDTHRKQFDIIVASHSLWNLQESWERRQRILNLWNMLTNDGGVLIVLEKGVPRGFEVVADSRQYLLDELFQGTHREDSAISSPHEDPEVHHGPEGRPRAPSRIIAPCPHTSACPLYAVSGTSPQRKDYCRFKQRYFRPPFYQRIVGAKHRNHEDVEFSYIAIQKGHPLNANTLHGQAATDRAFQGYDIEDEDLPSILSVPGSDTSGSQEIPITPRILPIDRPLPRAISPPLKRHGHVHLDLCTPSGTLERWTVPKSFGDQPYRDARKANWGDLWALGAKQREMKRMRVGKLGSTGDKDKFQQ